RDPAELLSSNGKRTVAEGVQAFNPVFDVTPADLIDAIVTEKGLIERPNLQKMTDVFSIKSSA
ncbi:MAG: S-methyl-5-thioribose-1-phosphate isomerase, partial [Arenimonas sp.]